jgi:hypothetical protein
MQGHEPSGDPMSVALLIERLGTVLGRCADEIGNVTVLLGEAEILYEDAFGAELEVLVGEYETRGGRLPGEEARRALIHRRIDRELYREVKRLTSRQDALQRFGSLKAKQLSGLQTEAKLLTGEDSAPTARATGHIHGGRRAA